MALPLLYGQPVATSTAGFTKLYYGGAAVVGPIIAFSATCSGVSAYLDSKKRVGYAIAAIATFASLPWTVFVMMAGIQRLIAISKDAMLQEKVSVAEVEGLLTQWGWMNLVRSGFAAIGGIVGMLIVVDAL